MSSIYVVKLKGWTRLTIAFLLCLAPGVSVLVYSSTLIHYGFGAVNEWWYTGTQGGNVTLEVNESHRVDKYIIQAQGIDIQFFDTGNSSVDIVVTTDQNGTVLRYSNISGSYIEGIRLTTGSPLAYETGEYTVYAIWVGETAEVTFVYSTLFGMHGDGTVVYIQPGYYFFYYLGLASVFVGSCTFIAFYLVERGKQK